MIRKLSELSSLLLNRINAIGGVIIMAEKLSIQQVRKFVEENSECTLISTEYLNVSVEKFLVSLIQDLNPKIEEIAESVE